MNILICIKCRKKYKHVTPDPHFRSGADEFASFLNRDYSNDKSQAFEKLMGRKGELGEGRLNLCPN